MNAFVARTLALACAAALGAASLAVDAKTLSGPDAAIRRRWTRTRKTRT